MRIIQRLRTGVLNSNFQFQTICTNSSIFLVSYLFNFEPYSSCVAACQYRCHCVKRNTPVPIIMTRHSFSHYLSVLFNCMNYFKKYSCTIFRQTYKLIKLCGTTDNNLTYKSFSFCEEKNFVSNCSL